MQNQVEEVKQKTDIVAIIGEHLKLAKAGKYYRALCPFHSEKTPSFVVSPELQIFKCFGCGESGDVFSFLEKYEGMDFSEALRTLADRAGVTLVHTSRTGSGEKEKLQKINEISSRFYHYLLVTHAVGEKARNYVKTRGLTNESIETFLVGYAPGNERMLTNFLVTKKKYTYQDIESAGVSIYKKDRFRNRIIFPLQDNRGNFIALAGRIMPDAPEASRVGKYINSPETQIYHKSQVLYGLSITRSFIKKANLAVIVEGELDLISSYQAGVKNIVAIKGSALTEEQLRILSRLTNKIILALDSDLAGDVAARRGIIIAQSLGISVRVMTPSKKYKDPDEFARADPAGYKTALKNAIGVWDFIIASIMRKHNITTGEGKGAVSREIVPILRSIDDQIVRAHYITLVAKKLGVPLESVALQVQSQIESKATPMLVVQKNNKEKNRGDLLEEQLLRIGLQIDPQLLVQDDVRELIRSPLGIRLVEEIKKFLTAHQWEVISFAKTLSPELKSGFEELMLQVGDDDYSQADFKKVVDELRMAITKEKLQELEKDIQKYEQRKDKAKLKAAKKEFALLSRKLGV
jgi:DNA primase